MYADKPRDKKSEDSYSLLDRRSVLLDYTTTTTTHYRLCDTPLPSSHVSPLVLSLKVFFLYSTRMKGENLAFCYARGTKTGLKKKECMIASQTVQWGDIRVCSITRPFVVFLLLRLDIFFAQFIVASFSDGRARALLAS